MLHDWPTIPLGKAGRWLSGGTPSMDTPAYWGGSVPWVSAKDMKRFELWDAEDHITEKGLQKGSHAVEPGAVLIVVRGMILAHTFPVAIAMSRMAFNQDIKAIRCHPHVDPRFLAHWLVASSARVLQKVTDTSHGTKRFDIRHLQRHPFPLPLIDEQQAIARILDAVDVAIERTRTAIAKAESLRSGLAKALLGCGLDERGRLRDPLDSPGQFHVTPVGRIPIAWTVSKVATEFGLSTGFTLGEHRRPKVNKRRYLRVANVQRERIDLSDVLELEASEAELEKRRLEENDLLIVEGHANPYESAAPRSPAISTCTCSVIPHAANAEPWLRKRAVFSAPIATCAPRSTSGPMNRRYWGRIGMA